MYKMLYICWYISHQDLFSQLFLLQSSNPACYPHISHLCLTLEAPAHINFNCLFLTVVIIIIFGVSQAAVTVFLLLSL